MKVLGLRSYRDKIAWAVVDGASRAAASLVASHTHSAPDGTRGEVLRWVRDEITDLVNQHQPDAVVLCCAEGQTANNALIERSQVDGVILEVAQSLGSHATAKKSATIRSDFGAQNNAALISAVNALPAIVGIPPTAERREPAIAALSRIP